MAYSGRWLPENREKYNGDPTKIKYRSLWERSAFKWCDANPEIQYWSSESVVVPYKSAVDGKTHRYFVDLKIKYTNGNVVLVEIKPKKQTKPPRKRPKTAKTPPTRRYISEVMTYATNVSKWTFAEQYAEDRGWTFEIWTEDTLDTLGIKIIKDKYKNGKNGISKSNNRRRKKRNYS